MSYYDPNEPPDHALSEEAWTAWRDRRSVDWTADGDGTAAHPREPALDVTHEPGVVWRRPGEAETEGRHDAATVTLTTPHADAACVGMTRAPAVIALLNHEMPDDHPGKLTYADLVLVRLLGDLLDDLARDGHHKRDPAGRPVTAEQTERLCRKLEALLPPEHWCLAQDAS